MSDIYYIRKALLTAFADKIRSLTGTSTKMSPANMLAALDTISVNSGDPGGADFTGLKDMITYVKENDDSGTVLCHPPLITNWSSLDGLGIANADVVTANLPFLSDAQYVDFSGNTQIQEFNAPSALNAPSSFANCTSLETVNLNASQYIETNCFENCSSLSSVNLSTCTIVDSGAFSGCTSLAAIDLPACTTVRSSAFNGCTSLATVNLPVCTEIESSAFYGCTSLASVNLSACTTVGANSFAGCTSLVSITLPACTSFDYTPFEGCENLTSLSLPMYSNEISNTTFSSEVMHIENLYCPKCEGTTGTAFEDWTDLTSITLPLDCEIRPDAFVGVLDPDNKVFKMYFVEGETENICNMYATSTLFGEPATSETEGSDSGVDSSSESGEPTITATELPGLKIFVPDEILDTFKSEFYGGRYALNIFPVSEDE